MMKQESPMAKTVLITGTSSGYGKATAELFLTRGWNVVATMRRPDPDVFGTTTARLKVVALDVTQESSIAAALAAATAALGGIDVLVNNAGIGLASVVEATPDHIVREVFETNTFGVMATCRAVIPLMRRQGGGVIVNVTSSAAIAPMPMVAVYAGSKFAVEGFTEALSYEVLPFGIRARLVEPGYAPSTRLTANGAARMEGLIPRDYGAFAQACFARIADYPVPYCTEAEVAETVLQAATEPGPQLRFLAGADTRMVSDLRWTTSEARYLDGMRAMFGPRVSLPAA
jgi:NAD(P)-dependent dehydrogenase (short-subunit alcohol dehydrogenase family)